MNNATGKWIKGTPGDGVHRTTDLRVRQAAAKGGKVPDHVDVEFAGGAPKFDSHVRELGGVRGQTDIQLDIDPKAGQRTRADRDFAQADKWFAERLNEKKVPHPSGKAWTQGLVATWRGDNKLTWHHHENMTTMQLVPEAVNNFVRHIGGRTLQDEAFTPKLPFKKPPE